jgi:RNA polymerase sigma factor (sigma-70 family)
MRKELCLLREREYWSRLDDAALMGHLAAGDMASLGELYMRYLPLVKSAIARFAADLDGERRDDLCHDVFVTLSETAWKYEEKTRFKAWLYGIAVRKARNASQTSWLRKKIRGRMRDEYRALAPVVVPADFAVRRDEVSAALGNLPTIQRDVLLLHVEGFTGEEIAKMLSIRTKTVWTRLHRARRAMMADNRAHPTAPRLVRSES